MKNSGLTLVIGDKNLSSWSMRAWLAVKVSKLEFNEIKIILDQPNTKKLLTKYSPSGRVPVLIDAKKSIWDSLAIAEYVAEISEVDLWPHDPAARAVARSYTAEMHSGFPSLRSQLSMEIQLRREIKHLTSQTIDEIKRVLQLWSDALKKYKGPFLFGEFSIADAFFAPVVFRFLSYQVSIADKRVLAYMSQIQNHPDVKAWVDEAMREKTQSAQF